MSDSAASSPSSSPAGKKVYDLFPNTKPAVGKYMGVISGLLRNLPPRDVLSSTSAFHQAGAVTDAKEDAELKSANGEPSSPASPSRNPLDLLLSLCEDAKRVFDAESVIVPVKVEAKDRLVLVGDIHGQFRDLQQHVLSLQRGVSDLKEVDGIDCKYLFLGDYVDRGPQGVEAITLLLALKVEYPANVFMIRGNHEDAQVSRLYGFLTECKNKLDVSAWSLFNEVFNNIPLGATAECENGTIFCCHGGLSPSVENIAALQFLNRAEYGNAFGSEDSGEAIDGLLWSDPGEHKGFRRNMRGCGYTFGTDTTAKFCETNGVAFVCRAHQMVMEGYQWEHENKLLTVFSAPNYCGINHNKGAIAIVMGSEAHQKHKAANPPEDTEKKDDTAAAAEDASGANASGATKIPIVFQAFTSAPSEPCTLYYCTPNGEASACTDSTPDANGSPTMPSLTGLSKLPLNAPAIDGDDGPTCAATPRPPADPNLNIEGLKYFGEEKKK